MGTMIQSTAADYVRYYRPTGSRFYLPSGYCVEIGKPLDLLIAETKAAYGRDAKRFTFTAMRGGIVLRQWQIKRPGKPPVTKTQSFRYVQA